jgi:hypothetical protein
MNVGQKRDRRRMEGMECGIEGGGIPYGTRTSRRKVYLM